MDVLKENTKFKKNTKESVKEDFFHTLFCIMDSISKKISIKEIFSALEYCFLQILIGFALGLIVLFQRRHSF